jgi:hypothetical protein
MHSDVQKEVASRHILGFENTRRPYTPHRQRNGPPGRPTPTNGVRDVYTPGTNATAQPTLTEYPPPSRACKEDKTCRPTKIQRRESPIES